MSTSNVSDCVPAASVVPGRGGRVLSATPARTVTRCLVCGSREVRSDEVIDRGLVWLHECPRCEHRWTARPVERRLRAAAAPGRREAATAA